SLKLWSVFPDFAGHIENVDENNYGTPPFPIHVSEVVALSDHVGPVDLASINRHCVGRRLDRADMVADSNRQADRLQPARSWPCRRRRSWHQGPERTAGPGGARLGKSDLHLG